MEFNLYHYKVEKSSIRVIDGDTIEAMVDLGFRTFHKSACRLFGINTAELKSKVAGEREKAQVAKIHVQSRMNEADAIIFRSEKLDKYGRPLVTVYYHRKGEHWKNLNDELIMAGLAVPYSGD